MSATISARAQATLAELASAARSGALTPTALDAYVRRMSACLRDLAAYEEALDEIVADTLAEEFARMDAIQASAVAQIHPRRMRA